MKKYKHSETFKALKSTKEVIEGNLSSAQYLHTLDYFLWNALQPVAFNCPEFFYGYVSKCVSYQTLNPNIKYTSGEKSDLPLLLFSILNEDTKEKKFSLTKKLYLNRGIWFGLLSLFQTICKPYTLSNSTTISLDDFDRTQLRQFSLSLLGCGENLHAVLKEVSYWDFKAREFKSFIVQKHTRMAMLQAQKTYVDFNHYEELDDVSQIYLMIVNKAVDRCDSRLGVLTTFVQRWLRTARSQVAKLSRRQMDSSLDELIENLGDSTELGISDPDRSREALQELSYESRLIDKQGIVRTHLGIPQYVTLIEMKTLLSFQKH